MQTRRVLVAAIAVAALAALASGLVAFVLVAAFGSHPQASPVAAGDEREASAAPLPYKPGRPALLVSRRTVVDPPKKSWVLEYVSMATPEVYVGDRDANGLATVPAEGKRSLKALSGNVRGYVGQWSPDGRYVVVVSEHRNDRVGDSGFFLIDRQGKVLYGQTFGMGAYLGWKKDSTGFFFDAMEGAGAQFYDVSSGRLSPADGAPESWSADPGLRLPAAARDRIAAAVIRQMPKPARVGKAEPRIISVRRSPDGTKLAVDVELWWVEGRGDTGDNRHYFGVWLADADGSDARLLGPGLASLFRESTLPGAKRVVSAVTTVAPVTGFAAFVPLPTEVSRDPQVVGTNVFLALAFALAFGFTSTLFNSTIKENGDVLEAAFSPLTALWRRLTSGTGKNGRVLHRWEPVAVVSLCGLVYGFLDPAFGFSLTGLVVFVSMALSVGIVTYVYDGSMAAVSTRRYGAPARVRVHPGGVLVAVACVVLSRFTGFRPGYVYGFVGAMAFAGAVRLDDTKRGRLVLFSAGATAVVSLGAWLLAVPVAAAWQAQGGSWLSVLEGILTGVFVAGLEGLVFGLLPLAFLDGERIYRMNKVAWFAVYATAAFLFWHVLLNPGQKYLSALESTSVQVAVALLVFYVFLTTGTYFYFRLLGRTSPAAAPEEA